MIDRANQSIFCSAFSSKLISMNSSLINKDLYKTIKISVVKGSKNPTVGTSFDMMEIGFETLEIPVNYAKF
jgi:hypothetical protein